MTLTPTFFYTNVQSIRGKIYARGYRNGEGFYISKEYTPTVFVHSTEEESEGWRNLQGQPVRPLVIGNIDQTSEYIKNAAGSYDVYGFSQHNEVHYAWINDIFPGELKYSRGLIRPLFFDIETETDGGFGDCWNNPFQKINAITAWIPGVNYVTWGLINSYLPEKDDCEYRRFDTESDLLHDFYKFVQNEKPDIITGWNIDGFDIPYLINRTIEYHKASWVNLLSPWKLKPVKKTKGTQSWYNIPGIASLDYMRIYQKFCLEPRESYSLDNIAYVELGEKKLDYSEYDSLHDLYKNNWKKFIDYNIRDTTLVKKLDDKLKYLDLAITYAYLAKVNFEDVFGTVNYWDVYIHNHLWSKKIAVPPRRRSESKEYPGAFVKDPLIGLHKWLSSFDLDSLYPSIIVQWNLSPETFIEKEPYQSHDIEKEDLVNMILNREFDNTDIVKNNETMTANGYYFSIEKQGFLPEMVERAYELRKDFKRKMIETQKEYEKTKDPVMYDLMQQYNATQHALKIQLNSLYGALGNAYFRYFDVRFAEAITVTGRTVIKWTEKGTNEYLNKLLKTDNDYIIAIDTDSVFVCLDEFVRKIGADKGSIEDTISIMDRFSEDKLLPMMARGYDNLFSYLNGYKPKLKIKRESLGNKALWVAKKKYAMNVYNNEGVSYSEPKMKIRGLEIVRTSTPEICRESIRKTVKLIFDGDESIVQDYIREFKNIFIEKGSSDIAFPRGVNDIKKWSGTDGGYISGVPMHVRASIVYNNMIDKLNLSETHEKIKDGEKIKFIYLKMPNPTGENVIAFKNFLPREFALEEFIDHDLQFEKAYISPIKTMLDAIGWSVKEEITLDALFS